MAIEFGLDCLAAIWSYNAQWNIILAAIVLCSLFGMAIFIERLLCLKRAESDTNQLLLCLRQNISDGNLVEAIATCEESGGAVANIIKAGLMKHNCSKERMESAMEMSGLIEIAQLEKNAKVLSILAHIAPLIGLLGTVLGFIEAFGEMRLSGLVDISTTRLGEAMEYALITTAAGLAIAIPAVIAYNYLVSRIEGFILEMQVAAAETVDLLAYREEE